MKLAELEFLVDQSVHRSVTRRLQALGIHAEHVGEIGLSRASDAEILTMATSTGRAVLTHDLDFGGLAILATTAVGVVILRPAHHQVSDTLTQVEWLLRQAVEVEFPFVATCQPTRDGYLLRIRDLSSGNA